MLDFERPGRVPYRSAQDLELLAAAGNESAQQGEALPEPQVPQQERRRQILVDGQVRVERIRLEDHGQIASTRSHVVDHGTVDFNVALGLGLQPRDDPQGGRLAAPGGTDQGQELTVGDVEVDAVEDLRVAEGLGDALESDARQGSSLPRIYRGVTMLARDGRPTLRGGCRSTATGRTACHSPPDGRPGPIRPSRLRPGTVGKLYRQSLCFQTPSGSRVAARGSRPDSGAFTRRSRTVPIAYIAPSTALTSSSTAVAESYAPLKWAVTTS